MFPGDCRCEFGFSLRVFASIRVPLQYCLSVVGVVLVRRPGLEVAPSRLRSAMIVKWLMLLLLSHRSNVKRAYIKTDLSNHDRFSVDTELRENFRKVM